MNSLVHSDPRKRQTKRDEAIRRKIENDFSKKKKEISSRGSKKSSRYKGTPGTVSSLRPNEPIMCKSTATALEAARLMSAKRENCILVLDDTKKLVGIFTAKDLAFRVVASGKVAAFVTVAEIMTPDPMCVTSDTAASEALDLMVQKGFRHLPILAQDDTVFGVLDITKCYQEAMEKLERMYESSKKLYDALDNVNSEIGLQGQPFQVVQYFENLKEMMGGPTLESVLDDTTLPVYINVKCSVYDAAVLMKSNRTTALLVKGNENEEVSGIFTSKDVVLRVIAAGLDPKTCSVVRVMTPQPDCAPSDLTIHEALRQMFNGHYLNLPVVEDNEIVGIVEVLKLTYATLNQLKVMKKGGGETESSHENSLDNDETSPVWNRFWTALDDTDSVHSGSYSHPGSSTVPTSQFSHSHHHKDEISPTDSISCVNDNGGDDGSSIVSSSRRLTNYETFGFKFRSPGGRIHRISFKPELGVTALKQSISEKIQQSELKLIGGVDDDTELPLFAISYRDDDGDLVAITTDQDVVDCVGICRRMELTKADIFVHHPQESIENITASRKKLMIQDTIAEESSTTSGSTIRRPVNTELEKELIPGVPNELLVPGAILTLAASILIVFTLSRR